MTGTSGKRKCEEETRIQQERSEHTKGEKVDDNEGEADEEEPPSEINFLYWKSLARVLCIATAPVEKKILRLFKGAHLLEEYEPFLLFSEKIMELRTEEQLRNQITECLMKEQQQGEEEKEGHEDKKKKEEEEEEEAEEGRKKKVEVTMMNRRHKIYDSSSIDAFWMEQLAIVYKYAHSVESRQGRNVRELEEVAGYILGVNGLSLQFLGRREDFGTSYSAFDSNYTRVSVMPTRALLRELEQTSDPPHAYTVSRHRFTLCPRDKETFTEEELSVLAKALGMQGDHSTRILGLILTNGVRPVGYHFASGSMVLWLDQRTPLLADRW